MKIKIWGARGSIPTPIKPDEIEEKICRAIFEMPPIDTQDMTTVRKYVAGLPWYLKGTAGGNTSCVEIQSHGETFIIDAGSGLRELGLDLMKGPCGKGKGKLHLFFSHPHWDHLQGFPFFAPAFIPGNLLRIYSIHDLEQALTEQQRPLNFPVTLSYMQATREFIRLTPEEPFTVGNLKINTLENAHPGKAYSYRFDDGYSIFVYANDAEYQNLDESSLQPKIEFFRNADALVFDTQYTLKEAWQKVDWGHSSAMIGVDLARKANVKRLLLFHHDPTYSDDQLQGIQARAIAYQAADASRSSCEVIIGQEGLTLDLTPPGTVDVYTLPESEIAVLTPISIFDEQGVSQLAETLSNVQALDSFADSIVDLSQVETLTTASLKALISLHRVQGIGQMVLASPSLAAQKVIELSDYRDLFAVYPSVEAAQAALQARKLVNLPGQLLKGRYQIIEPIGGGFIGITLKARDVETGQLVALKILSPMFNQRAINRFLSHTYDLISLDYRHIVKVFDAGTEDDYAFVVEDHLSGETLQARLANSSEPLPYDQALDVAYEMALALEYSHSRGVHHGNLKPQNIFLTDQGIKLSGFGLGRLEENRKLLALPLILLSPEYLSPEQISGKSINARTDLYTFGVILYKLFTGSVPYGGEEREILQAHLDTSRQIPAPSTLNPKISPLLEHLILKLLDKMPHMRYQSAQQVRYILYSLIATSGETIREQRWGLFGRADEINALHAQWAKAQTGVGQMVLLSGDPGIGKTYLAAKFAAQLDSALKIEGSGNAQAQHVPYYLVGKLLESCCQLVEANQLTTSQAAADLNSLVQFLLSPRSPTNSPNSPEIAQFSEDYVLDAVVGMISRTIKDRPWLFILDDLQWADRNSLTVIEKLCHRLDQMPLMIIGAYRSKAVDHNHHLHPWLLRLATHSECQTLSLSRLTEQDINNILTGMWGEPVPETITETIYSRAKGNPLYTEELARSLTDDNLITLYEGVWVFSVTDGIHWPENVQETIWRRTRQLSPDAQALLRRAAVLGNIFPLEVLNIMTDMSGWHVLGHLDMALGQQLVREAPGNRGRLQFSHPIVQSILHEDLDATRYHQLHQQAGEVLALQRSNGSSIPAAILAYHFSEAGNVELGAQYSMEAARDAEALQSPAEALFWHSQALNLLAKGSSTSDRQPELPAYDVARTQMIMLQSVSQEDSLDQEDLIYYLEQVSRVFELLDAQTDLSVAQSLKQHWRKF